MIRNPDLPTYVADTHALFWYLENPDRLSLAADAVFRLAAAGGALIVVPAIVVADLFYLTAKAGFPILPSDLLSRINASREFAFSELGQDQLEAMESIAGVTEMHDRLIAAEAMVRQAPVISRDEVLQRSKVVDVIW